MAEEQARRRLGHIHDFIMRTICEVEVGRDFLHFAVQQDPEAKTERMRTLELMIVEYILLCAARLLEKRRDSLGLKDLKKKEYTSLIVEPHVRDRVLSLVDKAYEVGKPLREFRNNWLAHVGQTRNVSDDFNPSATEVVQIAKEINKLLCKARNKPLMTVDEYLEACRELQESGLPEHRYVW